MQVSWLVIVIMQQIIIVICFSSCWKPDLLKLDRWPTLDLENSAGPFIWPENGITQQLKGKNVEPKLLLLNQALHFRLFY